MPAPDEILRRVKRCALLGNLQFTRKARDELILDGLTPLDVRESLTNAKSVHKTMRSTSSRRSRRREYLHVIISPTLSGVMIYTKGKFVVEAGIETYYLLVSYKRPS